MSTRINSVFCWFLLGTLVIFLGVQVPSASAGGVLFVSPTANGSGDCSSWTNACTLQTALSSASSEDEIWVQYGVHKPTDTTDRTISFALVAGVEVYGGFEGDETAREQRDFETHLTILSGDIDDNDTNTDGNYIAETSADINGNNSYHVLSSNIVTSTAVLDGFTITAGMADGSDPYYRGGGVYNENCNPTLNNITFMMAAQL